MICSKNNKKTQKPLDRNVHLSIKNSLMKIIWNVKIICLKNTYMLLDVLNGLTNKNQIISRKNIFPPSNLDILVISFSFSLPLTHSLFFLLNGTTIDFWCVCLYVCTLLPVCSGVSVRQFLPCELAFCFACFRGESACVCLCILVRNWEQEAS